MLTALKAGYNFDTKTTKSQSITIKNPPYSIKSTREVERALALSALIDQALCSRIYLWQLTVVTSELVRKTAVSELFKPISKEERDIFWIRTFGEVDDGVRGLYLYGLLQEATEAELAFWVSLADDLNWSVRWCLYHYLEKHPPSLKYNLTKDPDLIMNAAYKLKDLYVEKKK
ncbi:hypothetical protein [Alkalihalobacillus pseudalcaliphilus]|uniref:hypothetical protein n=1 Tax=Alkalihalobacillus pseudalcaliphilus TaxID=79884 RepID=UPI00064E06CA|nr:hypothetical protein [Alkalihalobacillus pseudalcaliphilus]KMK76350.1 hypothetical protein AB990_14210 [Alkalihalobacillus pseudalcaliphilus]